MLKTCRFSIKIFLAVGILSIILSIIGCGPAAIEKNATTSFYNGSYPSQSDLEKLTTIEAYPVETGNSSDKLLIGLNKPITSGDAIITGFGPQGMPIRIINITFMGSELGAGIINDDGTFSIEVEPVSSGIRIGLAADLESVGLSVKDILPGQEAINIPQVGYFVDSFVIE